MCHEFGVLVIPVYDKGSDAVELIAEAAAMQGCSKVLIGTSRHGALYHLVKGHFRKRLETGDERQAGGALVERGGPEVDATFCIIMQRFIDCFILLLREP